MSDRQTTDFVSLLGLLEIHALASPSETGNLWQCGCGLTISATFSAEQNHREHLAFVIERDYIQWRFALNAADWAPLPEDVTMHTMASFFDHGNGRSCMYHSRLGKWTFENTKECLREHPSPFMPRLRDERNGL